MIHTTKHKPLRVEPVPNGGALLDLPQSQLDSVRYLLDAHGVEYWVSDVAISFDGGPEQRLIKFGYRTDPATVQAILDGVDRGNLADPR